MFVSHVCGVCVYMHMCVCVCVTYLKCVCAHACVCVCHMFEMCVRVNSLRFTQWNIPTVFMAQYSTNYRKNNTDRLHCWVLDTMYMEWDMLLSSFKHGMKLTGQQNDESQNHENATWNWIEKFSEVPQTQFIPCNLQLALEIFPGAEWNLRSPLVLSEVRSFTLFLGTDHTFSIGLRFWWLWRAR